ncbi:hypothetical protein KUTeg_023454 [Tegillarca granosa]|uniref:Cholinephosphotransferase 1 n=1 Tax=Tegillarca granosa TaxID=220873 RepID=A0ABQ9E231_TEGGR|nr:hypothetical protein KUTeg_023454 [Tegillarca granosa]
MINVFIICCRFDVTESQLGVILIYLLTALFGPYTWDFKIPVIGMPLRTFLVFFSLGPTILQLQANLSVIRRGGIGRNKSTVADTSTIFPVLPIGVVLVLGIIIAYKSPSSLYLNHPCLYLLSFGLVAAKVINRLVVAHMSKSELDLVDSSIVGPAMLFLNQYFNCFINEYLLLWICFIYVVQDMLRYSYYVCNEICDFLGIFCFDIITPHPKKNNKNKN